MRAIPIPELITVLLIGLAFAGLRTLWGLGRGSLAPDARRATHLRNQRQETEQRRSRLLGSCALLAIISVPLILKVVPPNNVYGFRTNLTLSSPGIWYPANSFLGWALLAAAMISGTALLVLPATADRWLVWAAFLVPVLGAVAASFLFLGRIG
jgi:hypothetical protein